MIDPIELKPTSKASLIKVIRMPAGSRKQVVFRLVGPDGQPVNLVQEPLNPPADPPVFGAEKQVNPMTVEVRLRARDQYLDTSSTQIDVVGKLLTGDDCQGLVEFDISDTLTGRPGVYLCEIGQFVVGGVLIDSWPVYLSIEPSLFAQLNCHGSGPLTIPEIRLAMGDLEVGEVSLLDALEFEDVEILYAIRQIVDMWNETPPLIRTATFTTANFPYRHHWTKATIAHLYSIAARKYLRNQLNYQAGGITIDDQKKYDQYMAFAKDLMAEVKEWMMHEKVRLNMTLAWRTGL